MVNNSGTKLQNLISNLLNQVGYLLGAAYAYISSILTTFISKKVKVLTEICQRHFHHSIKDKWCYMDPIKTIQNWGTWYNNLNNLLFGRSNLSWNWWLLLKCSLRQNFNLIPRAINYIMFIIITCLRAFFCFLCFVI